MGIIFFLFYWQPVLKETYTGIAVIFNNVTACMFSLSKVAATHRTIFYEVILE
jgi:hypothetical protein